MKNPINFFDAELINNEWWFSNLNFNALMKMNSESGETEMISTFEGIPLDEENLHIKTIISGDLLFFIPRYKNIIHIWNTKENHFEKSVVIDCEKSGFFINALKDNGRKSSPLAGDYYLLNVASCPSVIVECGFLSNPQDERLLISESYQKELANAIYYGCMQYLTTE